MLSTFRCCGGESGERSARQQPSVRGRRTVVERPTDNAGRRPPRCRHRERQQVPAVNGGSGGGTPEPVARIVPVHTARRIPDLQATVGGASCFRSQGAEG